MLKLPNESWPASIKHKQELGFTLIEVLIAIFVLSSIIYIFVSNTDTLSKIFETKNRIRAQNLVTSKIEELRNTPFNSLPSCPPYEITDVSGELKNGKIFSCVLPTADTGLKEVLVWAQWNTPAEVFVIKTLISDSGLNEIK